MSEASNQAFRIGVMCNGNHIHRWQQKCLEEVLSLENISICHVIQNTPSEVVRSKSKKSTFAYRVLRSFVKPSVYEAVRIEKVLSDTSFQKVKPIKKGRYTEFFGADDLEDLKKQNLDLIIRFGFGILKGEVLNCAKFGIWSYHHCDEKVYRGGPAGFWEIYNGLYQTGSILQRLTEKIDGGIILKKGYFKTIHHSFKEQLNQILYGSAGWVKQVIIDIRNGEAAYLNNEESASKAVMNKTPSALQVIGFSCLLFINRIKFHLRRLFYTEFWNIGIVKSSYSDLKGDTLKSVKWLNPEGNSSYLADPFTFSYQNENYLIYEWYSYFNGKARIALSKIDDDFQLISRHVLTPEEFHASYPFIVKEGDNLFVLPETHELSCIHLYELDMNHFQLRNEIKLVSNFDGVDNSLIYFKNKWWLFCTSKKDNSNTNLYLFYGDSLKRPFKPHANNPVKTSVSSARPGGMPFIKNGELFRPAQNSAKTYGHAVSVQKVTKISETTYEEIEEYELKANEFKVYNQGLHTISGSENLTTIDAKMYRFDLTNFLNQLRRKTGKGN